MLAALLAVALLGGDRARADEISVSNVQATTTDPDAITFSARVTAPAGLQSASVVFRVLNPKEGDVGGSGIATFGPGPENDVSFTLETRANQRYIPVGSVFRFHWEFVDLEGDEFASEELEYLFLDGRYRWNERQDGAVAVYYYGSNESLADNVLQSAVSSLSDTEALLQVEVPYPIRVMVWASESDGQLAMRQRSAAFDALVRTGGQRVAPDLLFVFAATPDVVRHEAAHIVTAVAGDGPFSRVPSWLDEGTAVYMQGVVGGYGDAIEFAVQTDRTLRLRNLDSPSNNPGEVDIFYGQSWSTVDLLITEFGEAAFADLYRTIRGGSRTDDAFEAVYGFDQDGLYNHWRETMDLDAIDFAPRVESTQAPQAEATRTPLAIPTGGSGSTSGDDAEDDDDSAAAPVETATTGGTDEAAGAAGDDDGSSNSGAAIIVGLVAVLLAAGLGGAAIYLAKRPKQAA
ncbi:MAG: hypothetical protein DWG74_03665 [Chloroflexi bacterium]|nr:hypothetical protein [Chloroflexota bacterium]